MAAAGDVVAEAAGSEQTIDIRDDYVARLLTDWDGGDRALNVVWDNGNGAAGEVLAQAGRSTARRAHRAERRDRRALSRRIIPIRPCRRTWSS